MYITFFFQPTQAKWRTVFITAAAVYAGCCTVFTIFASGKRQPWDNPDNDKKQEGAAERGTTQDTRT